MNEREVIIAADHPAFLGHFDGAPILPGVALLSLVVESLSSEGAAVVVHAAKFLAPVRPGTVLQVRTTGAAEGRSSFEIHAADRCVASGSLTLGPRP
ncbi:hypothetical protein BH09PSE6_BH09PSE6_30850 [soil metagenome]